MKEVYIAYFDFMGFSNFIENNENKIIMRRIGNILSDLERCLSKNNRYEKNWKLYADLSNIKLNKDYLQKNDTKGSILDFLAKNHNRTFMIFC